MTVSVRFCIVSAADNRRRSKFSAAIRKNSAEIFKCFQKQETCLLICCGEPRPISIRISLIEFQIVFKVMMPRDWQTNTQAFLNHQSRYVLAHRFRLWSHCVRIWPMFYTDIQGRQRQNKQMRFSKWRRSQWRLAALTCTDMFRRLTAETKSFCLFRPCMPVCRVVSC